MHAPQAHESASARPLPLPTPAVLAGMALGLVLFQRGGAAPLALPGLLIFGALALLRPGLALLFVPLTAPLYLIPAAISGLRAGEFLLPLHEAALLVTLGAAGARWLWRQYLERRRGRGGEGETEGRQSAILHPPSSILSSRWSVVGGRWSRSRYAPHLLFLVAGAVGVLLAVPDGRDEALREFRWLIVEPLLFYALVKAYAWPRTKNTEHRTKDSPGEGQRGRGAEGQRIEDGPRQSVAGGGAHASRITQHVSRFTFHVPAVAVAFIAGGAVVGLLGLLQFVGLDIVEPLLGAKRDFSENIVEVGGVRRVTSVYGHPNNLGLYLGRVWPLAAALALALLWNKEQRTKNKGIRRWGLFFVLCSLFCVAGIVVSFSRAAWLAAVAAGTVVLIRTLTARGEGERGRGGEGEQPKIEDRSAPESDLPSSILHPPSSAVGGRWSVVIGVGALLVVLGGLALTLRGGIGGGSDQARLLLWREALAYIRQHPLGLGLDQFYQYHNPEFGRSLIDPALLNSSEVYAAHPHNLLLDTWLRVGPLGLLAFGWLLARFVRSALAQHAGALRLGALAALVAALVQGLVDNFYFVPDLAFAFWLLLALVEGPDIP